MVNPVILSIAEFFGVLYPQNKFASQRLAQVEAKYLKDLKINLKSIYKSTSLSEREASLIAISIAANEGNEFLLEAFSKYAQQFEVNEEEIAEAISCASLMSANNVLYRFRHFMQKDVYDNSPAKIKMTLMMNPKMGKALFELLSVAVSAVNGCEQCLKSHESGLLQLGETEVKIFEAVRVASIVVSASKVL